MKKFFNAIIGILIALLLVNCGSKQAGPSKPVTATSNIPEEATSTSTPSPTNTATVILSPTATITETPDPYFYIKGAPINISFIPPTGFMEMNSGSDFAKFPDNFPQLQWTTELSKPLTIWLDQYMIMEINNYKVVGSTVFLVTFNTSNLSAQDSAEGIVKNKYSFMAGCKKLGAEFTNNEKIDAYSIAFCYPIKGIIFVEKLYVFRKNKSQLAIVLAEPYRKDQNPTILDESMATVRMGD